MKFEFSPQIFGKYSHIKSDEKLFGGCQVFLADRRDEVNSRISQFCKRD